MENNENKKSSEALPDEAMDAVSGGTGEESMEVLPFSCHDCPRRDMNVRDFLDADGCAIKLCPTCAKNRRRKGEMLQSLVSM